MQCGIAGEQISLLVPAHVAHLGHDVAGGGLDDGDAGVDQLSVPAGQIVQIAPVRVDGLGDLLDLGVQGGINVIAAVVELQAGLIHRDFQFIRQVGGDGADDLVHEPGVDLHAAGGPLYQLLGGGGIVAVGELQDLVLGSLIFLLCQIAESRIRIIHFPKDILLPLLVQFPGRGCGPVISGNGDIVHGSVHGRIVGDGDQAGTLRHIQVPHILAEVVLRRRLHTVAALAQIDEIQIVGQDLFLGVILLKFQRPEDLPDLPVDGAGIVLRHVFQHLLGDGGAAEGLSAGEYVQRRAGGPLPVHALVLEEPLVLNGHGGLPKGVRDLVIGHQHAVLVPVDRLELHPLPGLLVLIIDKGAEVQGVIIRVDIQRRCQRGVHILHKNARDHSGRTDADQDQRAKNAEYLPSDASPLPRLRRAVGMLFRRPFLSSVLQ